MSDSRKYTSVFPHHDDVQRSREQHCSENGVSDKFIICFVLKVLAPQSQHVKHAEMSLANPRTSACQIQWIVKPLRRGALLEGAACCAEN
eukprot:1150961-Pelagomonas_calceolata.AAC.2